MEVIEGMVGRPNTLAAPILTTLLAVCCFCAANIDIYFGSIGGFRLYDVGAILSAILPFLACILLRGSAWHYFATSVALIFVVTGAILYGHIFSQHQDANSITAALTLRSWLYYMLAPAVWVMTVRGFTPYYTMRLVKWAFAIATAIIIYFYITSDLQSMKESMDGEVSNIVRVDDIRGFRLVIPHFAVFLSILISSFHIVLNRKFSFFDLSIILMCSFVLWFGYSRILLAALPVAVILFSIINLFKVGTLRYIVVSFAFVIYLFLTPLLLSMGLSEFSGDSSAVIRSLSLQRAQESIARYPFFGYGQAIASQIPYDVVFGKGFFPSDLGTTGVIFRYGYVGLVVYILVAVSAVAGAIRAHVYAVTVNRDWTFGALSVVVIMMVLVSFSWPAFFGPEGILLASLSIGYGLALAEGTRDPDFEGLG